MSVNIGVVNWFTKKKKTIKCPEESEGKLVALIRELKEGFAGKNLAMVADNISAVLERSDFFKEVSSDHENPVCAMYYHAKNTAAIAVCLAYDQIRSDKDFLKNSLAEYEVSPDTYSEKDFIGLVRLGALLVDLGKIRSYDSQKYSLEKYGEESKKIVREILGSESAQALASHYQLEKILPSLCNLDEQGTEKRRIKTLLHLCHEISSESNRCHDLAVTKSETTITVVSQDPVFPHIIDFNAGNCRCNEQPGIELLGFGEDKIKKMECGSRGNNQDQILLKDLSVTGGLSYLPQDTTKANYTLGNEAQKPLKIGYLALDIKRIQEFITETDNLRMLRGGSVLVEDVLSNSRKKIAETLSDECVIFAGGGNLLSLLPSDSACRGELEKSIEHIVSGNSKSALSAGIVTGEVALQEFGDNFSQVIKKIQDALDRKKQAADPVPILKPPRQDAICQYCNKRIAIGSVSVGGQKKLRMCSACAEKWSRGERRNKARKSNGKTRASRDDNDLVPWQLMEDNHLEEPDELTDLGNSIAIIAVDGNMMGRLFLTTHSPAEYAYKSATFDKAFKTTLKKTIEEYIRQDIEKIEKTKDSRVRFQPGGKGPVFLAIRPIFGGGDDLLIVTSARAAIPLSNKIITAIAECFMFETELPAEGQRTAPLFKNPTVTVSAGIAIAQSKFPVYFVIEQARKMEGEAKREFRKTCQTDEHNIIRFPLGSLAFTAVSGAMPSGKGLAFVIRNGFPAGDPKGVDAVIEVLDKCLDAAWKRTVADLVTSYDTKEDHLNLLKSTYASVKRRGADEGTKISLPEQLDRAEYLATMFTPAYRPVLEAAKMVVPHVWHSEEED